MQPWEYWGISEEDWRAGWRRTIEEAVEAASGDMPGDVGDKPGPEFEIRIRARKRSGNAIHDYIVT